MQVDAVSLIICVIIYLHLGFSSGHGYAYQVPLTFGLTLAVMLTIVYTVLYMQNRCVFLEVEENKGKLACQPLTSPSSALLACLPAGLPAIDCLPACLPVS